MTSNGDSYKARQKQKYKKQLEDAYLAYERQEPLSLDKLLIEVRKFASRKIHSVESDPEFKDVGTISTGDDYAQEAVIGVWKGLVLTKSFRGDVSNFYAWVHSIVFAKKQALKAEILEQKFSKVDIQVSRAVDPNEKVTSSNRDEYELVDNPKIHEGPVAFDIGCTIPKSVQGLDRTICNLLLTEVRGKDGNHRGRNYAEVGMVLDLTEVAVRKRFERLRDRVKAERAKEKSDAQQKRDEALREQSGEGFRERYAKFKEGKL